ncbi:MAG: LysR family transcriptional regulator [Lachnospiraceae bacterium]|nr:LysR family transcriptional regulator [Lachnospiraceae bacterium]
MAVNFEYYKVFYYIGLYKNITRAANELCLSQPTVTKEVHKFEEEIGCKLFQRTSKGICLSAEGNYLFQKISPAVEILLNAEREMNNIAKLGEGIVGIGIDKDVTGYIIRNKLDEFQRNYPSIHLEMSQAPRHMLEAQLLRKLLDVAFLLHPAYREPFTSSEFKKIGSHPSFIWKPDVNIYRLTICEDVLVAGGDYREIAAKQTVQGKDLYHIPLIYQTEDKRTDSEYYIKLLREGGKTRPSDYLNNDEASAIRMLKDGFGIGVVCRMAVQEELRNGSLKEIHLSEPLMKNELLMLYSRDSSPNIQGQILISRFLNDPDFAIEPIETEQYFKQ